MEVQSATPHRHISSLTWGLATLCLVPLCFQCQGVKMDKAHDPPPAEWQNATALAAGIDALTGRSGIASASAPAPSNTTRQVVISSWVLVTILHDGSQPLEVTAGQESLYIRTSLRNALADSLGVCQPLVKLVHLHKSHFGIGGDAPVRDAPAVPSVLDLIRRSDSARDRWARINVTQVKATYEVRVVPLTRMTEAEVARHVDSLQLVSHLLDLNRFFEKWMSHLSQSQASQSTTLKVMVGELGYASRRVVQMPPLSKDDMADCIEEELLSDVRRSHQFATCLFIVLLMLITCVGSAVFTLKVPSHIPSRMNPLLRPAEEG